MKPLKAVVGLVLAMAGESTPELAPPKQSFVIGQVDGHVLTIDAWTGELRGVFGSGGPLIRPSVPAEDILSLQQDGLMVVVPGFNGNLYWIGPSAPSEDGQVGDLVAHELPLNAMEVTNEPRTLCSELDLEMSGDQGAGGGSGCGLVVGERSTTLYALDVDSGAVRWAREAHTGVTHVVSPEAGGWAFGEGEDVPQSELPRGRRPEPMLLQRDEYTVRFSSLADGSEHWNVSVSIFSAVDVDLPGVDGALQPHGTARASWASRGRRDHLALPDGAVVAPKRIEAAAALPRLLLTPEAPPSTSFLLEAVDPASGEVLWKRPLSESQAVASVFGVAHGTWITIDTASRDSAPRKGGERGHSGDGVGGGVGVGVDAGQLEHLLEPPPLVPAFSQGFGRDLGVVSQQLVAEYRPWDGGVITKGKLHITGSGVVYVLPSLTAPSPLSVGVDSLGSSLALDQPGSPPGIGYRRRKRDRFWLEPQPSALAIAPPQGSAEGLFPTEARRPTSGNGSPNGSSGGHGGSVELSMEVIALVVLCVLVAAGAVALVAFRFGRTKAAAKPEAARTEETSADASLAKPRPMTPPVQPRETPPPKARSLSPDEVGHRDKEVMRHEELLASARHHLLMAAAGADGTGARDLVAAEEKVAGLERELRRLQEPAPPPLPIISRHGSDALSVAPKFGSPMNRSLSMGSLQTRSVLAASSGLAEVAKIKVSIPVRNIVGYKLGEQQPIAEECSTNSPITSSPHNTPKQPPADPPSQLPPPMTLASTPGHTVGHTTGPSESAMSARSTISTINPAVTAKWSVQVRYRHEFEQVNKLGEGGFGAVFQARNKMDGTDYAIKKVKLNSQKVPQIDKALREVRILAQLEHKHVIRYIQAWLEPMSEADKTTLALDRKKAMQQGLSVTEMDTLDDTTTNGESPHKARRVPATMGDDSTVDEESTMGHKDRSVTWSDGPSKTWPESRRDARREKTKKQHSRGTRSSAGSTLRSHATSGDSLNTQEAAEWEAMPEFPGGKSCGESSASTIATTSHGDVSEVSIGWGGGDQNDVNGIGLSPARSPNGRLKSGLDLMRASPLRSGTCHSPPPPQRLSSLESQSPLHPPPLSFPSPFALDADAERDAIPEVAAAAGGVRRERRPPPKKAVWHGEDSDDSSGSVGSWTGDEKTQSSSSESEDDDRGWEAPPAAAPPAAPPAAPVGRWVPPSALRRLALPPVLPVWPSEMPSSRSSSTSEDAEDITVVSTVAGLMGLTLDERSREVSKRLPKEASSDSIHCGVYRGSLPLPTEAGTEEGVEAEVLCRSLLGKINATRSKDLPKSMPKDLPKAAVKALRAKKGGIARHRGGKASRSDMSGMSVDNDDNCGGDMEQLSESQSQEESHEGKAKGRTTGKREAKGRRSERKPAGAHDLYLYIQMQYCPNNTLRDFLDSRGQAVDVAHALHIFIQIARGLEYVHSMGMIHRDLKPSNCFFMGDGTVKVGDFGLSRSVANTNLVNSGPKDSCASQGVGARARRKNSQEDKEDEVSPPPTPVAGPVGGDITSRIGTRQYASPEQTAGGDYDNKTDIYSLGIMLFEMCHPAFMTGMERAVVTTNLTKKQQLPSSWKAAASHPAVSGLLLSMLSLDPARRPTAAHVVEVVAGMQAPGPLVLSASRGKLMLRVEVQLSPVAKSPAEKAAAVAASRVVPSEALALVRSIASGPLESSPVLGPYGDPSTEALHSIRLAIFAAAPSCKIESYGVRESSGVDKSIIEFILAGLDELGRDAVSKAVASLPNVREVKLL